MDVVQWFVDLIFDQKMLTTVTAIIIAVVGSGALFIGANKLLDLAPTRWAIFGTGVGAMVGFSAMLVLWSNRIVDDIYTINGGTWTPDVPLVEIIGVDIPVITVLGAVIGGVAGYFLAIGQDVLQRLGVGVGGGAALGLLAGMVYRTEPLTVGDVTYAPVLPTFDPLALVVLPIIGAAFGAVLWFLLKAVTGKDKPLVRSAVFWGTIGWILGAWLASDLDATGSRLEAIIALAGTFAGFGAWAALRGHIDLDGREVLAEKSRTFVFLAPALGFIGATLVIPLLRTVYLSFLRGPPRRPGTFAWFGNYVDIFQDDNIFKIRDWTDIFTSRLFFAAVILIVVGVGVGLYTGAKTGRVMEASGGSIGPIAIGAFLFATAIFTSLRGTIFNNLWWVFVVTLVATSMGLAIAVLADRAKYESLAKSLIFMPMAISFVGAGLIWRFMYIARDPSKEQTGLLNALWVGLGELSHSTVGKSISAGFLFVLIAGLLYLAYRGVLAESMGITWGSVVAALPLAWLAWQILGPGIGGFQVLENGEVATDTVLFLPEVPWNNVWMMVVLIWIQTGFAMVIFSAAIKAVPGELLEAARVDGATETQTFWRVTIPQIATTIGVVVTTLIVVVMKVFDIVKVMTNGNFDTQVIANEMWQRAFTELNFGLGSALAIVLFIFVLPIMYLNIRRMQQAAA